MTGRAASCEYALSLRKRTADPPLSCAGSYATTVATFRFFSAPGARQYVGNHGGWSTDHKRQNSFNKRDAAPVCDKLRSLCPLNAKFINIEAAQNDFSLDVVPPAPHCDPPPHQSNRNAGGSGEISTHRTFSAHRTPTGGNSNRPSRIANSIGTCVNSAGLPHLDRTALTGKRLRFFADRAAKKWPLRGSLKGPAGDL
jgi:hypothetical protein